MEHPGYSETSPVTVSHFTRRSSSNGLQFLCVYTNTALEDKKILPSLHIFKGDTVFIFGQLRTVLRNEKQRSELHGTYSAKQIYYLHFMRRDLSFMKLGPLYNIIVKGYVINLFQNPPQNVKRYICVLAATACLCGVCLWNGCGVLTF